MWADDNGERFPFHTSRKDGGTLELCDRHEAAYESNPGPHFQVMSNELSTPKALVCPSDSAVKPATDFSYLTQNNISYRLRTGAKVTQTNKNEVLAWCPIHRHVLRCDATVADGSSSDAVNALAALAREKQ
jgi:hypothetical protein